MRIMPIFEAIAHADTQSRENTYERPSGDHSSDELRNVNARW